MKAETRFRMLAEKALADAGITEPPVDLERVAESLCVPIRLVNLPAFFKGAVINEDGMPVLLLNSVHAASRQRVTIAHLLGHVLIVLDGGAYPRQTAEHSEAESVARELLMPAAMVHEQSQLWFKDYRYLGRLFGVDEGAMLEQMRALGIVTGPRGIEWNY